MTKSSSDQKYLTCLQTLKKLEEEVEGKLSVYHVKDSSGKFLTRYTLEYEDDISGEV